ncbi:SDR family NAD(P)-dependent oxidoreductase [Microlunatus parietis]|uniref:NAD(P)-dependent dehydrogenase (Short-subunit alcohol dehydrogenase family) n=1 Tax=Microlunatus parietis TaxID=682979 RepID=A0A7Y9LC34_9ACTN|nr:SDR family NAD(P)-dependent oxidoreductase [Microlunatus parietis]NYE71458.1 NAD(P)-dependent dehydrogenase (short-subunit alcohol dehydrogenase family) [Microlunatus parietis]
MNDSSITEPGAAVVLGVGPGLGLAMARRFARAGHPVAVVSRTDARHGTYLAQLSDGPAAAIAEVADVNDHDQLLAVLDRIERRLGPIEVLYHGPAAMDPGSFPVPIVATTVDSVRDAFTLVYSAVDAVSAVLPGMIERGRGTILLPTGLSAVRPMPELGNVALAAAALRNYAATLHAALADRGVYAGSIVIGGGVRGGDIYNAMVTDRKEELAAAGLDAERLAAMSLDPDEIAEQAWQLATDRNRAEVIFSVLD